MPAPPGPVAGRSLAVLLATRGIVVTCGPGGVGKTTVAAAAAAMAAARLERRVLVLTVDPARRLADAIGLAGIGNTETRVPDSVFRSAGAKPAGELYAAMLDMKQSWDALVRRCAPDPGTGERILSNRLYRNVSSRFPASHDYIAMERLSQIHAEGGYDLIVVDTPPTRNALDFLDAPRRMAEFFSGRLLRWLTMPYRSRLVNVASRPFYQVADHVLGAGFLADIGEFFALFQSMYGGFVERARAVQSLLADASTTFVVVSTPEPAPLRQGEFLAGALAERHLHLGAVVINKALPGYLLDPGAAAVATRLRSGSAELAAKLAAELADSDGAGQDVGQLTRTLAQAGSSYLRYRRLARQEAARLAGLTFASAPVTRVPLLDDDVHDFPGLLSLGVHLWTEEQ